MAKTRVVVGISGGVDSSVAALLLAEQGYDVHGVFMKNWEDSFDPGYCAVEDDLDDAEEVCATLGIPLHKVNFTEQYKERVFAYFLEQYRSGRTPNPDILCNKEIKFKAFLDHADQLGADYIATGHYARRGEQHGRHTLLKGLDPGKDQSYFLYTLNQRQLGRSLFPVGELQKSDVRGLAASNDLITHDKKDSTGICFIGERNFRQFLSRYLPARPGPIQTLEGEIIGEHQGVIYYTLGQRQGLGIGGRQGAAALPWYVVDKDVSRNTLIVAQGGEQPLLYNNCLLASGLHWIAGSAPAIPLRCRAKTRYRQSDQDCTITMLNRDKCAVVFAQAQRALTPGQSVVFYRQEECLGGGIIDSAYNKPTQE